MNDINKYGVDICCIQETKTKNDEEIVKETKLYSSNQISKNMVMVL